MGRWRGTLAQSDLGHEEVDARVDFEVFEAFNFSLDAHEQATETHVNRSRVPHTWSNTRFLEAAILTYSSARRRAGI